MPHPNQYTMPAIEQRLRFEQRQAIRAAQDSGKRLAAQRAEQRELLRLAAEREKQPRNVFREILHQDGGRYGTASREGRIRREALERQAQQRDIEIENELKEKAKAELLANNPRVRNAIDNARFTLKVAEFQKWTDDEMSEAQENAAIASEGEYALYWERQSDLQKRVWEREGAKLTELATVKSAAIEAHEKQREALNMTKSLTDSHTDKYSDDLNVTGPLYPDR